MPFAAQIVAPDVFDQLGVVDTLDPDAAASRHPRRSILGGGDRAGVGHPAHRWWALGRFEGHLLAVDEEGAGFVDQLMALAAAVQQDHPAGPPIDHRTGHAAAMAHDETRLYRHERVHAHLAGFRVDAVRSLRSSAALRFSLDAVWSLRSSAALRVSLDAVRSLRSSAALRFSLDAVRSLRSSAALRVSLDRAGKDAVCHRAGRLPTRERPALGMPRLASAPWPPSPLPTTSPSPTTWIGDGPPLVLVHGITESRSAGTRWWRPWRRTIR